MSQRETWAAMTRRHRQEKADCLQELADGGHDLHSAAEAVGSSYHALYAFSRQYGVTWPPSKKEQANQSRRAFRLSLRDAGLSLEVAAAQIGITASSLYKWCIRNDVDWNHPSHGRRVAA